MTTYATLPKKDQFHNAVEIHTI